MVDIWLCILLVLIALAGGIGIGYKFFYQKGVKDGAKARQEEIFTDYVAYLSLDQLEEFIELMRNDERGVENTPILIVRPDKYDWIDGRGFDINKLNLDHD